MFHTAEEFMFLKKALCCCYPLQFWEYDLNYLPITELTPENELSEYFFRFGHAVKKCRAYISEGHSGPALLSDSHGLIWILIPEKQGNGIRCLHVAGPMFANEGAHDSIRMILRHLNQSVSIRRRVNEALARIPLVPSSTIFQFTILLQYCINGERLLSKDISFPQEGNGSVHDGPFGARKTDPFPAEADGDDASAHFLTEQGHEAAYRADRELLRAVGTGNMNYQEILSKAMTASTGVRAQQNDALRSAKNSSILFVGLCSREAIRGGLPAPISYNLCDQYVDMVENTTALTELIDVNHMMLDDYISRVHRYQVDRSLSREVRIACDYIRMHPKDDLSLQHLSRICGYTDYYLSRKFKAETGMTPAEYINQSRIEYAKGLLRDTNLSVEKIAQMLHYRSRSYFHTLFAKQTGMAPGEYRKIYAEDDAASQAGQKSAERMSVPL